MSWNQSKLFEHVNIYCKYEASGHGVCLLFELHAAGFLGRLGGGFYIYRATVDGGNATAWQAPLHIVLHMV
jgi:hypothetical protein